MKEIKIGNLCSENNVQEQFKDVNQDLESIIGKCNGIQGRLNNLQSDVDDFYKGIQSRITKLEDTTKDVKDNFYGYQGVQGDIDEHYRNFGSIYQGVQGDIQHCNDTLVGIQNKHKDLYDYYYNLFNGLGGSISQVELDTTNTNNIGVATVSSKTENGKTKITLSNTIGTQGPKGRQGNKGSVGDVGQQGYNGNGALAFVGAQGEEGSQGFMGPRGEAGDSNTDAPRGDQGIRGPQGVRGDKGISGTLTDTDITNLAKLNTSSTGGQIWTAYQDFKAGAGDSGSDIRFKTNIKPTQSVLDDVLKLDVIDYIWDKKGERQRDTFGISAQQLEGLGGNFSKMVNERHDEEKTKWVDYTRFGVLAIKSIQEQQSIINQIDKMITELEENLK